MDNDATKYFWCVNCGTYGFFKTPRYRKVYCPNCHYEDICKLDEKEYKEAGKERPWILLNQTYDECHKGK